jgi:hypothetical protein
MAASAHILGLLPSQFIGFRNIAQLMQMSYATQTGFPDNQERIFNSELLLCKI